MAPLTKHRSLQKYRSPPRVAAFVPDHQVVFYGKQEAGVGGSELELILWETAVKLGTVDTH